MAAAEGVIRELEDGLVLRRATPADATTIAAFNASIHRGREATQPDPLLHAWTLDLANGSHPTCSAELFTVVEDRRANRIVSTLCLIPQTWTYAGIPFAVGQVELVGTLPEYRGKRLVRAQMDVVHGWSAELGHEVQVIGGIPYFYRQFGYEMALALNGGRLGPSHDVPALKKGEEEPFRVRLASEDDAPFIHNTYRAGSGRNLVAAVRDEPMWRYEIAGRRADSAQKQSLCIVESNDGERLGFFVHLPRLLSEHGRTLFMTQYELTPGTSWLAVTPTVLRYLRAAGAAYQSADDASFNVGLWLGESHPSYEALYRRLDVMRPTYAWYVRVPDLPAFVRRIAPALEARLAASPAAGHTGDLRLSFYRGGMRLAFTRGRLAAVEPWQPTPDEWGDVAFPDLTFTQLLLGYRSLDELRHAFADCGVWETAAKPLVDALFPKRPSDVWQIM